MHKNTSTKEAALKAPIRDAGATRASILDAAEEEFGHYGLQGARTESIAAQTGVTKGMIHYYFDNKENLYREVLKRTFERRTAQLGSLDLANLAPTEALKAIFSDWLADIYQHPNLAGILFFESLQNKGQYYREFSVASLYNPLIEVLQKGVASGEFRANLDPRHTAINLIGMIIFYICARENLSSLWPEEPNLLDSQVFLVHIETTITMVCHSVLSH